MYEPPLKPSVYDQRIGRIVRIGSEHNTAFIINLVMRGGWDQKVFDILEKKRQYTTQLIEKDVDDIKSVNKTADSVNINDLRKIVQKYTKNKK